MINHYNMAKHFTLEITDESFTFTRNTEAIAAEAALDGIYVLRTSLPTDTLTESEVVARYKKAQKACVAKEPEILADRVKRKDPGDFADRTREWVSCMKEHGLHIEVDAAGVWGFSNDYAAAELDSPWVDKCESKAFAGADV